MVSITLLVLASITSVKLRAAPFCVRVYDFVASEDPEEEVGLVRIDADYQPFGVEPLTGPAIA